MNLDKELDTISTMLIAKNRAYGNSALDPIRIFSTADTSEQIRVRLDDKLSRLSRGKPEGEDPLFDLIGYLLLLQIASFDAWPSFEIRLRRACALVVEASARFEPPMMRTPGAATAVQICAYFKNDPSLLIVHLIDLWTEVRA